MARVVVAVVDILRRRLERRREFRDGEHLLESLERYVCRRVR